MTDLLVRLFVKDADRVGDRAVRTRYGNLGSITGIVCNLILFVIKLITGTVTGAFSIVADGFNNLSDMGSSLITLLGFKLAAKPADKDHPFGHGRLEYVSAFIVSALILLVGFELFKGSVEKILAPETPATDLLTVIVLAVSILIKLWMALFNRKIGTRIQSESLRATAQDSLNDCISTGAVLIAVLILRFFGLNLDAWVGLAVSLFILWSGFRSVKDTLDPLLGVPPEKEEIEAIRALVDAVPCSLGLHDLIVHNYGPGRVFCSLHIEVPNTVDILECHEQVDKCEKDIFEQLGIEAVIHTDPVAVNDPLVNELRDVFINILLAIDPALKCHDFRIVKGKQRTNVIFDVVLPPDAAMTPEDLKTEIARRAAAHDPRLVTVITVDRDYT